MKKISLLLFLFLLVSPLAAENRLSPPEERMQKAGLVDVQAVDPTIRVDLKYATTDNFTGINVYGDLKKAFLRPEAAKRLALAQKNLKQLYPAYCLLVYDAARPRSVQVRFWAIVKGTDQQQYVADPAQGSIHNYGCAVDLTILNASGKPLDMGTPFDYFGDLAQPALEAKFLKEGKLTNLQVSNRKILREVMGQAGFKVLPNEWWHFNAFPPEVVRKKYRIISQALPLRPAA